jgi:hypothetical protein
MSYLALHVSLLAALAFLRLRRGEASLSAARLAVAGALAAPFVALALPAAPWMGAPAQVWSGAGGAGAGAAVLQVGARSMPAMPQLGWSMPLALFLLVALTLGRDARALRRKLRAAVVVRRVGRLRIAVSDEGPWTAALGLTGWIVLDRATASDARLRRIALLHELQHLRQRDAVWAWLLAALQPVFLFSPVARRVRALLIECEELACDAALVARGTVSARPYAAALLEVAERGLEVPLPALPALHGHSLLRRRIQMLLSPLPRRRFADALLLAAVLALACAGARATDSALADHRVDLARAQQAAARASGPGFEIAVNDVVLAQLNRLVATPGGLAHVRKSLARRPQQIAAIQSALAAQRLPRQLDAVPLVESGYENVDAGEHGAGLWQFIVPTAKHYGLTVAPGHDERMDPALEAAAAARYLEELYRQFGDWPLALAAYTQGQNFVSTAIEREKTRDAWELIRRGALETYAAKVMAAAMVIADPSLAGL